jgi:ribonuclease T1
MSQANEPRSHWLWWLLGIALLLAWQYWQHDHEPSPVATVVGSPDRSGTTTQTKTVRTLGARSSPSARLPAFLPAEAGDTIISIQRGGPFLHRQDGSVFGNREGHLPRKPRGWYHEYTVDTPGRSDRGTRRIITGGNPPKAWYYTSDHYDSFRAFNLEDARENSP